MSARDHDFLFPFQEHLVEWSFSKERAAIFSDCGTGKTRMALAWAQGVLEKTNGRILNLTPIAVGAQTKAEGDKIGIPTGRSRDGRLPDEKIVISNYEKLHLFNPSDFVGVVADEAGILKNHSGATRNAVIQFVRRIPYRLLCTATPSPNDYTELGNSVEALSIMRRVEMLAKYFVHDSGDTGNWRLKGHAQEPFWKFVASWARAVRHPRDLGFEQPGYDLPPLHMHLHKLPSEPLEGCLFPTLAVGLDEQRKERRSSLKPRCQKVAELATGDAPFVAWCALNAESELLAKLIPDAQELRGSDSEEEKEEKLMAFVNGQIRALVTKPSICSHGVNWQHCHRTSFFPSHSHEQFYQALRRFWRFGQTQDVNVHIVTTEAEALVLENLQRKERDADEMFSRITANMRAFYDHDHGNYNPQQPIHIPSWLS